MVFDFVVILLSVNGLLKLLKAAPAVLTCNNVGRYQLFNIDLLMPITTLFFIFFNKNY